MSRQAQQASARGGQAQAPNFRRRVLALVARIPSGQVATYGQLSLLAGYPRRARHVGNVLASLPPGNDLPWHRVINAQGQVSPRGGNAVRRQQNFLKKEGVLFKNGRVDLKRYRWEPVIDEAWARQWDGD